MKAKRKEAFSIKKEAKIDADAIKKDKILQAKEKVIDGFYTKLRTHENPEHHGSRPLPEKKK